APAGPGRWRSACPIRSPGWSMSRPAHPAPCPSIGSPVTDRPQRVDEMNIRTLALAATMLLAAGCQTQPVATPYPQRVLGPRASGYLEIEAVQEGKASSDLLRAGVRLYNKSLL